tara:strand:- start:3368 stop:6634 length:3267 start_codon:yes stop_codon:yes gene_type:complete
MSPVGEWKLTGLRVDYMDIARGPASVIVNDAYGLGVSTSLGEILPGTLFNTTINGPFTNATLEIAGVNLNVNLDPPSGGSPVGSGSIGQGSYYPDVDIGTNADGSPDCITTGKIFPITDTFSWTAPGTEFNFSQTNILGKPSANALAGGYAEGLGVFGSSVFDNWPDESTTLPIPEVLPAIADADGVYAVGCGLACTSAVEDLGGLTVAEAQFGGDVTTCVTTCHSDTYLNDGCANWGTCLAGEYGGMFSTAEGTTQFPYNDVQNINFVLEWHAIDGTASESGLGDIIGQDEDGDGTDYDRIFGLPYISSTYVSTANPLCDITGGALVAAATLSGCADYVAGQIAAGCATYCAGQGLDDTMGDTWTGCLSGCADANADDGSGMAACLSAQGYVANNGLTKPLAGDIVDQLGGEAAVAELVTGGCLGQVRDGIVDQCAAADDENADGDAGTPVDAVVSICVDASQSDDFAAACAGYGAAGALIATCENLGFDSDICQDAATQAAPAVGSYCDSLDGDYDGDTCEDMGTTDCAVLTNETFAQGLCSTLAGALTESETCQEWADGFEDSFVNDQSATQIPSWTFGAGGTAANMSCSDWGDTYVDNCLELGDGSLNVQGATDFYLMDLSLSNWGYFMTWNAAQYQGAATSIITAYCTSGAYTGDDPADCGGSDEAAGYALNSIATNPALSWTLGNDSDHELNPACLADGDYSDCSGRLHMQFTPTCIAEVEAHQIVAEFVDLEALQCEATGDVTGGFEDRSCTGCTVPDVNDFDGDGNTTEDICNVDANFNQMIDAEETCSNGCWDCSQTDDDGNVIGSLEGGCTEDDGSTYQGDCLEAAAGDGIVNVPDLVRLVNHILGTDPLGGYLFCAGDVNTSGNGAGVINVGDLVSVINIIFDLRVSSGAQDAIVEYNNNEVNIVADGFVAGAELIIEFSNDSFNVELAESFIGNSVRHGNNLHVVMANKDQTIENVLNVTEGEIISVASATLFNNSGEEVVVTFDEIQPESYRIVEAYPNPFNPSTTIGVELYTQSDLSIKVYNLTGQLVDEIANGNFSPNTYTWTWDAKGYASGIYFVTTKVGNEINNQKVMLIK